MTHGALFSGSGGFELAAEMCGIKTLWNSEIEPFPRRVTKARFPNTKQLGDIKTIDGGKIDPVDIISGGSPCQDMSIAGKRAGLDGSRSTLFHEQIRVVKEMRRKTGGRYPRYMVWENVPGAFISNKGEDFRCVLEETLSVAEQDVHVPRPSGGKWSGAGEIVGDGCSIAWRVMDAQYWGVPQRRRRIFLVADFTGQSAGKILFESEGLSGYSAEGFRSWQAAAGGAAEGVGETGCVCLNDQGGACMAVTGDVTNTLRAETHWHPHVVASAGFCTEHSAKARGIGYQEETSPMLRAGVVPAAIVLEHQPNVGSAVPLNFNPTDSRIGISKSGVCQTLTARMGTGGNQTPLVLQGEPLAFGVCHKDSNCMKSSNPKSGFYEATTSRTLDTRGGNPACNQGGIVVVEQEAFTNQAFGEYKEGDVASALNASDYKRPTDLIVPHYSTVRRITPLECARLQGFPDDWTDGLVCEDPSETDVQYWCDAWLEWWESVGAGKGIKKPKDEKAVRRWLASEPSDSDKYEMWGNGIALPCAVYVFDGFSGEGN